jgi:hypothetical protein
MPQEIDGENDTRERINLVNITSLGETFTSDIMNVSQENFSSTENFSFDRIVNSTSILNADHSSSSSMLGTVNSFIDNLRASKKRRIDDSIEKVAKRMRLRPKKIKM